ncbi:MAG: hypothetical protein HON35_03925 [Actinobacteria bacterium]|nr:hypothetical protein [Actinomycetota bacterium]
MRFLRQVLMVASLTLLLILAVALAGVAAGVNTYFGSDGAVTAQGPRIELDELASCTNIVVDLDRIEMALPQQLAILPGPEQKLRISTEPQVTISAVLLPREEADAALLGFNTCLMNLDSQNWSITRSAVGQPWLQVDQVAGRTDITSGESVAFDIESVFNSTLIIEFEKPVPSISTLLLDAEVRYPGAQSWALWCTIVASLALVLSVILVVTVIVKNRQGSRSIEVQS